MHRQTYDAQGAGCTVHALVAGAGIGTRMGAGIPKQYLELAGESVISRSIHALLGVSAVRQVVVSIAADDSWWPAQPVAGHPSVRSVTGGASRALSVLAGLRYILDKAAPDSWVLVHDAARPLVRSADINTLIQTVLEAGACGGILAVPVTDTIKRGDETGRQIIETPDRSRLWQAQTPQFFQLGPLHDAINAALEQGLTLTDEASALELQAQKPILVEGHPDNIKITQAKDLAIAETLLTRH